MLAAAVDEPAAPYAEGAVAGLLELRWRLAQWRLQAYIQPGQRWPAISDRRAGILHTGVPSVVTGEIFAGW